MRVFTIHLRRTALSPDRDAVLIKEGFCWPAFFFGPFWALWHRMWFVFLGICAVMILMAVAESALHVDPVSYGAVSLGISVLIGFSGNDWRRTALAARGGGYGYRLPAVSRPAPGSARQPRAGSHGVPGGRFAHIRILTPED